MKNIDKQQDFIFWSVFVLCLVTLIFFKLLNQWTTPQKAYTASYDGLSLEIAVKDFTPAVATKPKSVKPKKKKKKSKKSRVRRLKQSYSYEEPISDYDENAVESDTTNLSEGLEGSLASVVRVSKMPEVVERIRPVYTQKMKEKEIEGTVKMKILVDIDGKVKKILFLQDIGEESKQSSLKAIKKTKFKPALVSATKVAVWITYTINFELEDF